MTKEAVLDFWFGEIRDGYPIEDRDKLWWMGGPEVDRQIKGHFGKLVRDAANDLCESWKKTPRGRLALILLLDQFPRNIFRGTANAFAYDQQALSVCLDGLALGQDRKLATIERCFFYMPLEHSENLQHQNRCVHLFSELANSAKPERRKRMREYLGYAEQHRQIIERFGRFPHRNAILNRTSTPEESLFLSSGHNSFGQ